MSRADRSAVSVPYETLTALPSKMREASDLPQPARMAGEARADPGQGWWVPVPPRAADAIVSASPEESNDPETQESQPSPIAFRRNLVGAETRRHAGCDRSLRREGDVRPIATLVRVTLNGWRPA